MSGSRVAGGPRDLPRCPAEVSRGAGKVAPRSGRDQTCSLPATDLHPVAWLLHHVCLFLTLERPSHPCPQDGGHVWLGGVGRGC